MLFVRLCECITFFQNGITDIRNELARRKQILDPPLCPISTPPHLPPSLISASQPSFRPPQLPDSEPLSRALAVAVLSRLILSARPQAFCSRASAVWML